MHETVCNRDTVIKCFGEMIEEANMMRTDNYNAVSGRRTNVTD